jgi:cysteinyl-tRNA synthetase
MAQVWMHNGFLQVEGEKMSKSLGNFVTIRELRQNWFDVGWPGEAIRFNMLRTHYRQPMDWTLAGLDESHATLWDWYTACESVPAGDEIPSIVLDPLCDDLNTPNAIAGLHKLRHENRFAELGASLRRLGFSVELKNLARIKHYQIKAEAGRYELKGSDAELRIESWKDSMAPTEADVRPLLDARAAARARKDFKESDRIRDELAKMGVVVKDGKDASGNPVTTWGLAR